MQDRLEGSFGRFGRHMRIGGRCSVFHTASAEEVIHLLRDIESVIGERVISVPTCQHLKICPPTNVTNRVIITVRQG